MIRTPTTLKENEVEKDKGSPVVIMLHQKKRKEIFSMARRKTQYHPYTNFYFDYEKNQYGKFTGDNEAQYIFKKQEKNYLKYLKKTDESKGGEHNKKTFRYEYGRITALTNKLTFGYWVTATGRFWTRYGPQLNVLKNTKPLFGAAAEEGVGEGGDSFLQWGAAADVDWFDEVIYAKDSKGKISSPEKRRDLKGWTIWTDFIGQMRTDDIIKLNGVVGVGDEDEHEDLDEDEEGTPPPPTRQNGEDTDKTGANDDGDTHSEYGGDIPETIGGEEGGEYKTIRTLLIDQNPKH